MTASPGLRVYGAPGLLCALSVSGLILALVGGAAVDAIAIVLVAAPLAVVIRSFLRGRSPSAPVISEPESQDEP